MSVSLFLTLSLSLFSRGSLSLSTASSLLTCVFLSLSLSSQLALSLSSSLSYQMSLAPLSDLRCLLLLSLSSHWQRQCKICLCNVFVWCCVLLLCGVAWCCVVLRVDVVVPFCTVCAFSSCTANIGVCTFKTLPYYIRHGHFDGTHGSVLKVHTGESRANSPSFCLSVSLSLSLFLSVSCRLSLSVLNDNDKSSRPVGSLCTHGSDLPWVPECVGLHPFVRWGIVRFMQKQSSKYSCACLMSLGMQCACTCADGTGDAALSQWRWWFGVVWCDVMSCHELRCAALCCAVLFSSLFFGAQKRHLTFMTVPKNICNHA